MGFAFQFLSSLLVFVNIARTTVVKEYDAPASTAYDELSDDYKKFHKAIILANFRRPIGSGSRFFLKEKERSCVKRCDEDRNVTHFCHCDRLCPLYKDCCVDYWPSCHVTTKPFNQSTQELWECVDAKFRQAKNNKSLAPIAYMMINRCPVTNMRTNQSQPRNCIRSDTNRTNISERIPVTGEDGKTYRNAYCAECHGITNIAHWGLTVACLDPVKNGTNLTYASAYIRENCTWYVSPGNESAVPVSRCTQATLCESAISTAESLKYNDLVNKCKDYSQLLEADGVLYKNFHCASCNGKGVKKFKLPPGNVIRPSLTLFFDYKSFSQGSGDNEAEGSKTGESSDDVIQSYLTVIGLSLSIVCLLAVVMTYLHFTTLRTVPGLVLLALSLSLLAYQGLLLASPYLTSGSPGCKAMAILLHWMILSSFAWMTVMSYDVSKTFSRKGKSSSRNSSRSGFRRYVIFAMSTSSGIVLLTLTLGETNAVHVGYGESMSCWIGERLALILFFYIPVAIMLLFNAVSLVWTIFSIRNVTKLTKGVQKSVKSDTRGQNAKIYGKLSTVMGVTWFLGFGAPHNIVVAYLFIIVNSLQGVFIFVTFVLNGRTINMWRNTASSRSDRSSTNTRQTRISKFTKAAGPYTSTNQLNYDKRQQHETGSTNPQQS